MAVLLLRELGDLAAQEGLLRIQLVDGVAVEDPLHINVAVGIADFGDRSINAGVPLLQAGNQILNRLKDVVARARKQLGTGQIGLHGEVVADGDRCSRSELPT